MAAAKDAYASVRETLKTAGIKEPDAKARVIVAEALGIGLADIYVFGNVDAAVMAEIGSMTQRCSAGEPVEYVTGRAYFRHITVSVSPDVLIPRQETELVVEEAISLIRANGFKRALDMCTGTGCIAISMQTETGVQMDACDLSEKALAVAKKNAKTNNADVRFFLSDMFGSVTDAYDIIVCNPPYVSDSEYETLETGVRLFEPRMALTAGDGLEFYRILAEQAGQYLNEDGALVLEIGAAQGRDVAALLEAAGFRGVTCKKDYAGRDRIITARR